MELSDKELEQTIEEADHRYYNTDSPLLSDEKYDELREEYNQRFPSKRLKTGANPVGEKVVLPVYLGSLDKMKPGEGAVERFRKNYSGPYTITPKLDGISAYYYRQHGEHHLYTRGDGTIGTDISHMLSWLCLPSLKEGDGIRGELIMSSEAFTKYTDKSNPRNMVTGILGAKESLNTEEAKDIDFIGYEYYSKRARTHQEQLDIIRLRNIQVVECQVATTISDETLTHMYRDVRESSLYAIDGIVVTDTSKPHPRYTKDNPKYAKAFKMILDDQKAVTDVIRVIWNESRYGLLKPQVEVRPVKIHNVNYTFATGHNAKFIQENGIGPGAKIELLRSGDVIPYVNRVIEKAEPQMPDVAYEWDGEAEIVAATASSERYVKQLHFFFTSLGIKDVGPQLVRKLYGKGYETIHDWVCMNVDDIVGVEGIQEKKATKTITNIQNGFRHATVVTLLAASGTFGRGLGEKRLTLIFSKFPNLMEDEMDTRDMVREISTLDGFGETIALQFAEHFEDARAFWKSLPDQVRYHAKHNGTPIADEPLMIAGKLEGSALHNQVVLLTGFRDVDLCNKILEHGGTLSSTFSSKVTMLIIKDDSYTNKKLEKAKENGIQVLTKDALSRVLQS